MGVITGALQKGDLTDDNTPTLKGSAVPNGIVTLYNNDVAIGSAQVDSKGNWSFTPSTPLADGKYSITADATNAVGQTSDKTGVFDFIVDTTAPDAAENLLITDNVGDYQGPLKNGDTTDDNTPTFSGWAEPGSTVSVLNDGNLIGTAKVDDNGNWSFTPSSPLPDSDYQFTTTVTDKAGNTNEASPAVNITVDTSGVTVSLDKLVDDAGAITGDITPNGVTDDTRPEMVGSGKAGSIINIYDGATLLGSTTVNKDGSWSFTPSSDLSQGQHSITVTAIDTAGNTTKPTTAFEFTVDTTTPGVPTIESATDDVGAVQGTLNHGDATDDPTPTLTGKAEVGSVVTIYDGNTLLGSVTTGANGQWTFTPTSPQGEGQHLFHVTATDAAGNVSRPSADFELTMDFTAPDARQLAITGVDDQVGSVTGNVNKGETTDDTRPTISGTGTAGDTIIVYVKDSSGSREIGSTTVDQSGNWTLRPVSPLAKGDNEFTAVEVDPVGNATEPSTPYAIVVDASKPLPPVIETVEDNVGVITGALQKGDLTDDNTPTLKGSAAGSGIIHIYDNGVLLGTTTAASNGSWNYTPQISLSDGKHDFSVTHTNTVGQTSDYSNHYDITIDSTPELIFDGDGSNKGMAVTLNKNGQWEIFSNHILYTSKENNPTVFDSQVLQPNSGGVGSGSNELNMIQNATFIDLNRDGLMDIVGVDSRYSNGQQVFWNQGNGNYTAEQMGGLANARTWYGGVVAIDLMGDGYADLLFGDSTPNDAASTGKGPNSQIVFNNAGTFVKDDWYTWDTSNNGKNSGNAGFGQTLSGVDLNNDGAVDIAFHGTLGSNKLGAADSTKTNSSLDPQRLVLLQNDGSGKLSTSQIINDVFFNIGSAISMATEPSMTWADFNGDGYMDLFLASVDDGGTSDLSKQANSTILFNDGNGKLYSTKMNGIGKPSNTYQMDDDVIGGASVAVDWDGDGKMDVIEAPRIGGGASDRDIISGTINLYLNNSTSSSTNFSTQYLQSDTSFSSDKTNAVQFGGSISSDGRFKGNPVTGIISIDLDFDGAKDLLIFTANNQTSVVMNNNKIAYGTSMHFRILDSEGLNTFFGNTIQLIDSNGNVVSSQIINPQSGSQTNNSTGIVSFYGLNPSETYSVVLLRNVMGESQDIGGVTSIGNNTIENVNQSWSNLKAGEAKNLQVLTAGTGTSSASSKSSVITGTNYDDTFIAELGNKTYDGGSASASSTQTKSEVLNVDTVDFKLANNTDLTINLVNKSAQYTGWNTVTLNNIEGIAGGAGNDTFTDDAGNNIFEGRAGNDTFNLIHGGRDTLLYKPQKGFTGDNRGGNGSDIVNGFTLGVKETTPNADCIDISEMLVSYTFGGGAKWVSGGATMEAGETIANYLNVQISGNDTLLYIDRDGNGSAYSSELLLTLKDVQTDLLTLLANQQLTVDNSDIQGMSATTSDFQTITQMFTAGNDTLFGTEQTDVLLGGLGDDSFINIGKEDQVIGGDGNDTISIISTDFASISGDAGIDTLIMDTKGELLDLSVLKDKLNSVEIFDMANGGNTLNVSLEDVLRLGSEELAINSGNKAIIVNGEAGSTLQLEKADGQWNISHSNYQYDSNTYNVWTMGTSGIEVLVENTVNPVIL
ncbi:VCBS repeat-containing protein [Limnobaculum sp. M2-1]|uniref:Ig-like domain-containing protein n=1 Tax=Limnobaculum TaxID=2172100 RepID=UPI001C47EF04|nr:MULTISPECIES: Ig-like domain-containing protein [Limnobaculum]MBV7693724.1 VCBS repeat-containing protein [Limnobaculum sp. M2-1]